MRPLRPLAFVLMVAIVLTASASNARAQQMTDVLAFLLTNRSVPTDDFSRDTAAADTTRRTVAGLLQIEIGALPLASSASGFTYRLNRSTGTAERSSESFGPFFVNRSLTLGRRQVAVSVAYRDMSYDKLDGRSLRDGTLVATASQLRVDRSFFDVETLALRLRSRSTAFSTNVGLTDAIDIGITVPYIELTLSGERVDTYRGARAVQATASASASGIGDTVVRGRANVWRNDRAGVTIGVDGRLPTGSTDDLLGSGRAAIGPRAIVSAEVGRVGMHGDAGYQYDRDAHEVDLGGAITVAATPRVTLVGELATRRRDTTGRLIDSVDAHPTVSGVDTWRLTSRAESAQRLRAAIGVKWNPRSTWLLSAHATRSLNDIGLTAGWVPTITLDYSLGR
jgi:hypothetical protein